LKSLGGSRQPRTIKALHGIKKARRNKVSRDRLF